MIQRALLKLQADIASAHIPQEGRVRFIAPQDIIVNALLAFAERVDAFGVIIPIQGECNGGGEDRRLARSVVACQKEPPMWNLDHLMFVEPEVG